MLLLMSPTLPAKQPLFWVLIKITVNHKSCLRQALTTLCCFTCPPYPLFPLFPLPRLISLSWQFVSDRRNPKSPVSHKYVVCLRISIPSHNNNRASEIGRFGFLSSDKGWRVRRSVRPRHGTSCSSFFSPTPSDHLNTFSHPDATPLPFHEWRFTPESKFVAPNFYSDLSIVTFLKGKAQREIYHRFHK